MASMVCCSPVNICQNTGNPSQLIQKIVRLIECPLSSNYTERHWVGDIPYIIKLLYMLSDRVKITPIYKESFIKILNLCRTPPMLKKITEILTYKCYIEEYFSTFGYILAKYNDEVFDLILVIMKDILHKKNVSTNYISPQVLDQALARSYLPAIFTELMEMIDDEIYIKMLETMELLLEFDESCQRYVDCGILNIIPIRLHPDWRIVSQSEEFDDYLVAIPKHFDLSMKILWKLATTCEISSSKFVGPRVWRFILPIWRALIINKSKRQKRNNFIAWLVHMHSVTETKVLLNAYDDLAMLFSAFELGTSGNYWSSHTIFIGDRLDYKLKKLLLFFIAHFAKFPEYQKYLQCRHVVVSILQIITPHVELIWNEKQRCKLMRYCILVLYEILYCVIDDFIENAGPLRLLRMIESFTKYCLRLCTIIVCLHCVYKSLCIGGKYIAKIYREDHGVDIVVELLKYLINRNCLTLQIQCSMICGFCILEKLNGGSKCSRGDIVELCLQYLKRYLRPSAEDLMANPRVLISCLNFLWDNLILSNTNLNYFINAGGIYLLLDTIENSILPVQLIGLGILVDLCMENVCIPYILTWRGKNKTAVSLFLEIFRSENAKLKVKVTDKGVISDLELPLMGERQREMTFKGKKNSKSSPAVLDAIGSVRPKIYALFYLLNCVNSDLRQDIDEHYKISLKPLSIADEITKLLVENYLPLKFGEIWTELKRDIEVAGIIPLSWDQAVISTTIRRYYKWCAYIRKLQETLTTKQKINEATEEMNFYKSMRETRLSEALEALDELLYLARCTEDTFRLMAKARQRDDLQSTLHYADDYLTKCHRTYSNNLSVTPVFHQNVNIKSSVVKEPCYQTELLHPVSPKVSDDLDIPKSIVLNDSHSFLEDEKKC